MLIEAKRFQAMTGSVDNLFTHIQGAQCACYNCLAAELAERKDYITRLESRTDKALTEHAAGCLDDQARIAALEAELDKINGDYGELLYKSTKVQAARIRELEAALRKIASCDCTAMCHLPQVTYVGETPRPMCVICIARSALETDPKP
jgi:hypothetical protein